MWLSGKVGMCNTQYLIRTNHGGTIDQTRSPSNLIAAMRRGRLRRRVRLRHARTCHFVSVTSVKFSHESWHLIRSCPAGLDQKNKNKNKNKNKTKTSVHESNQKQEGYLFSICY